MSNNMKNVRKWFENKYENYEIHEYIGHLEVVVDNIVHYLVIKQHSGTDNKWLLRATTVSAFDRWANSTAIEMFFETDVELCSYLDEHQLDIYKSLLSYLTEEYDDLDRVTSF